MTQPRSKGNPFPSRADIVVVSHQNLGHLRTCLESIQQHTAYPYSLTVVDNLSGPDCVDYLKRLQGVRVIYNSTNVGYARACNQGARLGNGRYIVFLNNDVEVMPGWLEGLVQGMESDPAVAVVGPKLLTPDGRLAFAGAGVIGTNRHHVPRGSSEPDGPNVYNHPHECLAVVGACLMIRRDLTPLLGLFDEGYFFYWEDVDYCLNARAHGYRVLFWPASRVVHHGQTTSNLYGSQSAHWFEEGRRRFEAKWERLLDDPTEYR